MKKIIDESYRRDIELIIEKLEKSGDKYLTPLVPGLEILKGIPIGLAEYDLLIRKIRYYIMCYSEKSVHNAEYVPLLFGNDLLQEKNDILYYYDYLIQILNCFSNLNEKEKNMVR